MSVNPSHLGYIHEALVSMSDVLQSKNEDYRIDGEFSNFEFAASVTGLNAEEVILAMIAIKLGRLKGLADSPNHEAKIDTVKDLHGYAAILHAYALKLEAE